MGQMALVVKYVDTNHFTIYTTSPYPALSSNPRGVSWQGIGSCSCVKNSFEFKVCSNCIVRGNILENNWVDAQDGMQVLFTVRNQSNLTPWYTIANIVFENNHLLRSIGGFNILSLDYNYTTVRASNIKIRNNVIEDMNWIYGSNPASPGGQDAIRANGGMDGLQISHNTVVGNSINILLDFFRGSLPPLSSGGCDTVKWTNLKVDNNLARHGTYGIREDLSGVCGGTTAACATPALNASVASGEVLNNVLYDGGASAGHFSAPWTDSNIDTASVTQATVQFTDPARKNWRLLPTSPYKNAGSDGKDIGVDWNEWHDWVYGQWKGSEAPAGGQR